MHRFFVDPKTISGDQFLIKDAGIIHQISKVLRMHSGDKLILLDNFGGEFLAEISKTEKLNIAGKIIKSAKKKELVQRKLTLYPSLLKKDNFELVLQKCTELGVFAFQPIITNRTIKIKKEIPDRWRDIVSEAAEQSGRVFIPEIFTPIKIEKALSQKTSQIRFIAHEKEKNRRLKSELEKISASESIDIFIGPEGGFSENEISFAQKAGIITVSLGSLILRAETASIVASAAS